MLSRKEFVVEDFRLLKLRIFTIGYSSEGESILGIIDDGHKHLFSFVVDSYQIGNKEGFMFNATLEKLKELGICSIDAFIWTHPDDDHSKGIETLLATFDKEAKAAIFLPAMLNGELDITDETRANLDYLFYNYNRGTKYNMNMVVKNQNMDCSALKLTFKERRSGRIIAAVFHFLAPAGARLLRETCVNKSFKFNRMSIMFSLRFNHFDYLFCGDLMGDDVQFLDKEFLKNVQFVKIPHHGSYHTKQLPELFVRQNTNHVVATTTTFAKSNLPDKKTIEMYKPFCKGVYSTSNGSHKHSCIETSFNILDLSSNVVLSGNAKPV